MKAKGEKIADILYGVHSSPFGLCLIAIEGQKICYAAFAHTKSDAAAKKIVGEAFPLARITKNISATKLFAERIFKQKKTVPFSMNGTAFQIKVWNALLKIPKGKTKTYKDIAEVIGSPKAVRAVGTACGKNSIAYLIPCHRVVASGGKLGGYRWGLQRKHAMLSQESR